MEEITAKDFATATAHGKVIVDFYGIGCANCRMLEPFLLDLAQEYPDVKFIKVNVDTAPNLVKSYQITALPTLLFIKDGQPIQPFVGLKPKNFIKRNIEDLLN